MKGISGFGDSTLETCNVISWFQAFAFKWVNLYRYASAIEADGPVPITMRSGDAFRLNAVGLCTLNAVDP